MMAGLLGVISVVAAVSSLGCLLLDMVASALACHVLAGLAGALASVRLRQSVKGSGLYEYALGLGIPCVGGPVVWLYTLGEHLTLRESVAKEFTEYIDASMRLGDAELPMVGRSQVPTPGQVAPMTDVLRSDASEDEKRNAIEALSRLETPDAVTMLRSVLTSESTEVRFYAASALSRLEERLALRLKALEEDLATGRQDRALVELEMARTYFDYAYYRLTDETRRADYLERAALHAARAAEEGSDPAASLMQGRALLDLRRYDEAEKVFSSHLGRVRDDVKGLIWRAEARFRLGSYPGVCEDCRRALQMGGVPEVMADAIGMWA